MRNNNPLANRISTGMAKRKSDYLNSPIGLGVETIKGMPRAAGDMVMKMMKKKVKKV